MESRRNGSAAYEPGRNGKMYEHTILVVDDNPTNIKVVAEYLSYVGFRVLVARTGHSALERAQHGQPDLILLDVLMPGIDGFETCRRLKQDPATATIPVIFMTALTETHNKVQGFQVGGVDYITKPVQQEELLARVHTHLRISDLTERLETLVADRTAQLQDALTREQALTHELQQALARADELNAIQTQVIRVVSHEFRTPLHVIAGSVHLLSNYFDRLPIERRASAFERIEESVGYLTTLLDTVFDVSVLRTARGELETQPVDVQALCRALVQEIRQSQPTRQIVERYSGLEAPLGVDAPRVRRIVSDLLANALKFSPDNRPVMLNVTQRNGALALQVVDEGIGIPSDEIGRVFDLFYRAENTVGIRGLGVGLAVVRTLVAALGGSAHISSAGEGQGCTVSVELPLGSTNNLSAGKREVLPAIR